MSEKGQRIFKWIVWIVILAIVVFKIISLVLFFSDSEAMENSATISRKEWNEELCDRFGDEISLSDQDGYLLTGEYAALKAMNAIGDERLSYLTDGELTDQAKIDLAVKEGIISEKKLDDVISKGEGTQIISNALDLYCSPEKYPEYFECDNNTDILDADKWNISEYDKEAQTMTAAIAENLPEVGNVIMFTDEYGITQAKRVEQIEDMGSSIYSVSMSNVTDVSELFDSISFSGASDFGYLAGTNKKTTINDSSNPFVITSYAANKPRVCNGWEWLEDKTAFKRDKEEVENKCDLELKVEIKDIDKNSSSSMEVESYISIKTDNSTTKYVCNTDDKGSSTLKVITEEDVWPEFEMKYSDAESKKDKNYLKTDKGIAANVKIEGLAICASGYYQMADPYDSKNYVEVIASADKIDLSAAVKTSFEGKIKVGSIAIPIAATYGVISINVNFYIVFGADGELTLWYEIDNPKVGLNISTKEGMKPITDSTDKQFGIKAKIELNGGIAVAPAIMILDSIKLADPGADVRAYASVSTVDVNEPYKLKDMYEGSTCYELKAQAPVVTLEASEGKDSLMNTLLDALGVEKASYEIIKKDSDSVLLKKMKWHVEVEKDEEIEIIEMKNGKTNEDVCTHIEKKKVIEPETESITEPETESTTEPETKNIIGSDTENIIESETESTTEPETKNIKESASDKLDSIADEVEDRAQNMLEEKIQSIIERLIVNSCGY